MDEISESQFTFIWKIKNCLSWYDPENCISSPTFTVSFLNNSKWSLDFIPRWYEIKEENFSELYLRSVETSDTIFESFAIAYNFELVDMYGNVLESNEFKNEDFKTGESFGCDNLKSRILMETIKLWCEDTLTLRCTLTSLETTDKPQATKCEAVSVVDDVRTVLKWDLPNFGFLDAVGATTLPCGVDTPDLKITLDAPCEDVIITIHILDEKLLNKPIKFKIIILSNAGGKIALKCDVHTFESMEPWQYPNFVRKEVVWPFQKCLFICEYSVSTGFLAASYIEKYTHDFSLKTDYTPKSKQLSIQNDFQKLYINKKFSDIKLRADEKEFLAHKAVLAARSPVFSTMFDQEDMLETLTGVVDIGDMDGETLQHLIEFMYTETMSVMDCDSALKLLLAADKYQVQALVEECCSVILNNLGVENACEVMTVADMINHEHLKVSVLSYILDNVTEILSLPNWSQLLENNVKLASDILRKLSDHFKCKKYDD